MRTQFTVVALATCLGATGCRKDYLVRSTVLAEAQARQEQLQSAANSTGRNAQQPHVDENIAVEGTSAGSDGSTQPGQRAPVHYLRLSALQIDEPVGGGYHRVSVPDRRAFFIAGGILAGLGLASVIGGAIGFVKDSKYSCVGDGCGVGAAIGMLLIDTPAMIAGGVEIITSAALFGVGARARGEVSAGRRDIFYITEPDPAPGGAPSFRPSVSASAFRVGIRF